MPIHRPHDARAPGTIVGKPGSTPVRREMLGLPWGTPARDDGRGRDLGVLALGYMSTTGAARIDDRELKDQAAALDGFCARRQWSLVGLVCDVEPAKGKGLDRPSLSYALDRLGQGDASCLLVTELGRLCRSVVEFGKVLNVLERLGARLVSLEPEIDTGTEAGRAAAHILSAVTEWERARLTERIRRGLAAARAKGAVQPTVDPKLGRWIVRMRGAGMTLQAIADELNEASVPTVRGGARWRPSSVQATLGYKRPGRVRADSNGAEQGG